MESSFYNIICGRRLEIVLKYYTNYLRLISIDEALLYSLKIPMWGFGYDNCLSDKTDIVHMRHVKYTFPLFAWLILTTSSFRKKMHDNSLRFFIFISNF